MADRKFAFMASLGFSQMDPETIVDALAEIGYRGIEWTWAHLNPRTHSRKAIRHTIEVTRAAGLEVSEACVQQDLVVLGENEFNDRLKLVCETISMLSDLGVRVFNLFTGPCPWVGTAPRIGINLREGDAWDLVFRAFDRFVDLAEKRNVYLAVENVWGMLCHDYYTARLLIDHYRSPHLGVNYDPSHDVLAGNLDVGWIVRQWAENIHHVHLKDAVGVPEPGRFLFPLLGEGLVNWSSFFEALDAIGYDGYLSVEFESFTYYRQILKEDPIAAARISMQQIQLLADPASFST